MDNFMCKDESRERCLEICKMRMDGMTYQQIGDKMGISRQRVEQILCTVFEKEPRKLKKNRKIRFVNIKAYLDKNNMSYAQFSDAIQMSQFTVRQYFNDLRRPSLEFVEKTAKLLCIPWEDVLKTDEEEATDESNL